MNQIRFTLFSLLAVFALAGVAFGQQAPLNLEGRFENERNAIELRWDNPDGSSEPMSFHVFRRAEGDSSFHMITMVTEPEFDDAAITLHNTYHYYVTAIFFGNVESGPSNIVNVVAAEDSGEDSVGTSLHFASTPVVVAMLNQTYEYDADVVSDPPGAPVCFSLGRGPDGMTISSSTGLIQWVPTAMGVFEVQIKARNCSGGESDAEQEYRIMVVSGTPGSVAGVVQDSSGDPIPGVRIKIFDVSSGVFLLKTYTDSTGHYAFAFVNPGTYFVKADPENENFEDQWFDGAKRMEDATPVTVSEGQSVTVNFTLHHESEAEVEQDLHLSGTVRDTANNPVSAARVSAFRQEDGEAFDDLFDDNHGGHHRRHEEDHATLTDSNGNYTLTLHAGSYILGASKTGFASQFWDHQPSPLEANIVDVHSDTTNFNFNLNPFATGSGSISGSIRSALDSSGLESHVIGFQLDTAGRFTGFVAAGESDSSGAYTLGHLPRGIYVVLAKDGHDFIPTFYSTTGGTPLLASATSITIDENSITGIDIYVQPDSSDGLNEVEGHVEHERGGNSMSNETVNLFAGVLVTLLGNQGQAVGAAVTGGDGSFLVPGLSSGTYTAVFQKPGSSTVVQQTSVSYAGNAPGVSTLNVQLQSSSSTETIASLAMQQSWNLVSVPVVVSNFNHTSLFPDAVSSTFTFQGTYSATDLLKNGVGYWVKYSPAQSSTVLMRGLPVTTQIIDVQPGWNLVGSISSPVAAASVTSIPAGLTTSQFFGYQGSYVRADAIEPGKGYWVKVSTAGKLVLSSSANVPGGVIHIVPTTEVPPKAPSGNLASSGAAPKSYELEQNFPNPFNPKTVISYSLLVNGFATLKVYDVTGREVATLVNGNQAAGDYAVSWDASNYPSGIYFYRLQSGNFSEVKKLMLVK